MPKVNRHSEVNFFPLRYIPKFLHGCNLLKKTTPTKKTIVNTKKSLGLDKDNVHPRALEVHEVAIKHFPFI